MKPQVALESTLISHGLPFPDNLETAEQMEQAVRDGGGEPVTIAIIEGKVRYGLSAEEKEDLSRKSVHKLSLRDIPIAVAKGLTGSTTVAATAHLAATAGISVFATGGIGGVHRDVERSFDISADLAALAKTPITVVCSGVKSILDIPRTLELLETLSVPVIGYRCDAFPAFFSIDSGYPVPYRVESVQEIAEILVAARRLDMACATLVVQPIPSKLAVHSLVVEEALSWGIKQAKREGIAGKDITPYLLLKLVEASGGKTLSANKSLICQNAKLAAAIACAVR